MSQKRWTSEQTEDQTGRAAVVTGANTGIGLETARVLANGLWSTTFGGRP